MPPEPNGAQDGRFRLGLAGFGYSSRQHSVSYYYFLISFVCFDRRRDAQLTAVCQPGVNGDKLCLGNLFYPPLHVEQAVLSLKRAARSLKMLPSGVVVSRSTARRPKSQAAYMQDCDWRLPVTSSTCRHRPFPIAAGLVFGQEKVNLVPRPALRIFW